LAILRRNRREVESGRHEAAGVGVLGGGHHTRSVNAGLEDLATFHGEEVMRQYARDAEIMADEQVGEALAGLQFT